jgi:hypothetical protein
MQIKAELPKYPPEDGITAFLKNWSEKTFAAGIRSGRALQYRFGLPRSTTLLHFISGGEYPIYDSRVATAMTRLGSPIADNVDAYLNSFCPLFSDLASVCGVARSGGIAEIGQRPVQLWC